MPNPPSEFPPAPNHGSHWPSEDSCRTLVDHVPGAVYRCDTYCPWRVSFMSEGVAVVTGWPAAAFLEGRMEWPSLVVPGDLPALVEAVSRAVAELRPYSIEYRIVHRDGSVRWVHESGRATHDERGQALYLEGVVLDTTDRRLAEDALRKTEERYRLAFLTSPDAININRLSDGLYLDTNDGFTRLTGWTRDDVIGRTSSEVGIWADPADRQNLVDALQRDGTCDNLEAVFRFKDGTTRTGLLSARLIEEQGQRCILSIARDISDRKEAEEVVRTLLERVHAILSSLSAGVLVLSEDGRVDFANDAFCRIFNLDDLPAGLVGLDAEEMNARTRNAYRHPDAAAARMEEIVAAGTAVAGEEVELSDGRVLLRHFIPLVVGGRRWGRVWQHEDLTEHKRAEEERRRLERQLQQTQKLEGLGVLAGGIAHDFNNILMAVLGHAELALDALSPLSPARGSIDEIVIASRRAADLCRQMLAYSGRASFAVERVDLGELIREMLHLLKTTLSKKAVLKLHAEPNLPLIKADPSQVRQVVMNLIINAAEAIGDRSGVIALSAGATRCDPGYLRATELAPDLAPGTYVHVEVSDTGSGMTPDTRARIFEPFFTTKFSGRGLGLAAVLGIVRAHGGAIKVYSEPGQGTTFKVLFPAIEDAIEGEAATVPAPVPAWRGEGTILLADDEESVRAVAALMLERLGFSVITAADGREAVEIYRARAAEIDLVVLDMTMPHLDGSQAFAELRLISPDVRIILASGYSQEDVATRFRGKSVAGVLQKPYTLAQMKDLFMKIGDESGRDARP